MDAAEVLRQDGDELVDDIQELEAASRAGVAIGNASDDVIDEQYSGIFYTLGPAGAQDPETGERTDVLVIGDRMDWQRAMKHEGMVNGPLLLNKPRVIAGPKGQGAAPVIAKQLLDHDRLGKLGCYLVRGDGRDEARAARARQRWIDWKTVTAREIQREWLHKMDAIQREGGAIPVQSPQAREAIEFLRKLERGEIRVSDPVGKRFRSLVDASDFDTYQEALDYNEQHYRDKVAGEPEAWVRDTVGGPAPAKARNRVEVPEPSAPVTPPAAPAADLNREVEGLLKDAEDLGVTISPGDVRGMLRGDAKVIHGVAQRIVAAAREVDKGDAQE